MVEASPRLRRITYIWQPDLHCHSLIPFCEALRAIAVSLGARKGCLPVAAESTERLLSIHAGPLGCGCGGAAQFQRFTTLPHSGGGGAFLSSSAGVGGSGGGRLSETKGLQLNG